MVDSLSRSDSEKIRNIVRIVIWNLAKFVVLHYVGVSDPVYSTITFLLRKLPICSWCNLHIFSVVQMFAIRHFKSIISWIKKWLTWIVLLLVLMFSTLLVKTCPGNYSPGVQQYLLLYTVYSCCLVVVRSNLS